MNFLLLSLPPNSTHHLTIVTRVPVRINHYHFWCTCQSQTSSSCFSRQQKYSFTFDESLDRNKSLLPLKSSIQFWWRNFLLVQHKFNEIQSFSKVRHDNQLFSFFFTKISYLPDKLHLTTFLFSAILKAIFPLKVFETVCFE